MKPQNSSTPTCPTTSIAQAICTTHPNTQAIYLYGTWGTEYQRPDSDIDIAVLLHHTEAKTVDFWQWLTLSTNIARIAKTEHADLVNIRTANTILCNEVITTGHLIHCADQTAVHEFEMLTLSFYQQLNADRKEILASGLRDGRFYDV